MKSNSEILNELFTYLVGNKYIKTQKDLANHVSADVTTISQAMGGNERYATKSLLNRVNNAFGGIFNTDYINTGDGVLESKYVLSDIQPMYKTKGYSIPMIPFDAVAGYNGLDHDGIVLSKCEQYTVPDFNDKGAEFMIRVSGNSMYPKYSNGDILACRKVHEILFFQWGKDYVIDSSQGTMIKRVYEDKGNDELIRLYSDNKEFYPEFVMPKSDIRSLSIVVGLIRTE